MKQIQTEFATAEVDVDKALLLVDSGPETYSTTFYVNQGELMVRQVSQERELFDGPVDEMETVFEVYGAASGLRGNQAIIDCLSAHRDSPQIAALLTYLKQS